LEWSHEFLGCNNAKSDERISLTGMSVKQAREKTVEFLNESGAMLKIDDKYDHSVSVCYKGNHDIEPMIVPNWFVRVKDFKEPALQVVKEGVVKIYPKWREKTYIHWMEEMRDWPISRQVVWGIRIPVWYHVKGNEEFLYVTWLDESGVSHTGNLKDTLRSRI
jgi:valyl-tRNA synthetase